MVSSCLPWPAALAFDHPIGGALTRSTRRLLHAQRERKAGCPVCGAGRIGSRLDMCRSSLAKAADVTQGPASYDTIDALETNIFDANH